MTERSEQVWQNLHNALEKKASEAELLRARVVELEAEGRFSGTWADYHEHMTRKVAELEAGRADLISTIEAMNEENAQLAHRLWCLENPE